MKRNSAFFSKGSKLYSISKLKCPRCHESDLFITKSAYNLRNFDKMPERCPICGLKFDVEPGFYLGAMYISYILTVLFSGISALILYLKLEVNVLLTLAINLVLLILLSPIVFRYSRAIWINISIHYKAGSKKLS